MAPTIAALVGATGGAGSTRSALELATALAADGADVAVLDAAYDTQGLARHLSGRLDPDMTALVTDHTESTLATGLVTFDPTEHDGAFAALDGEPELGRIACVPAHAPFERLARAKSPEAAQALERRIAEATDAFDYVLVDTPPLGSNPAVAAVMAADQVAVVTPGTTHGLDAAQMIRGRLQDVGTAADAVVAVDRAGDGTNLEADANAVVPALTSEAPSALTTTDGVQAMEQLALAVLDEPLDLPVADDGLVDQFPSIGSD